MKRKPDIGELMAMTGCKSGSVVSRTFAMMEIAEEEIDKAERADPENAEAIHDVFRLCCPTAVLRDAPDNCYRAHVRNICERAAKGEDMRPATDGELMACLCFTSMGAPLDRVHSLLYYRLAKANLDFDMPEWDDGLWQESWPGECDEVEKDMRRRLRDDGRKAA